MSSYNQNPFSNNNGSFNVTNSNITTNNYTAFSDEESRILSWISPLESWKRHSDVARTRVKGVGEWVLRSSEFQAWRRGGEGQPVSRILSCHGVPGAGKTFICSLVIDTLCDEIAGPHAAVGCLYCDYRGQKDQTAEVMIGSLLRQFVTGLPEIPYAITQAFRAAKTQLGGRAPGLAKIIELFPVVLERFHQVFICVDALDEFVAEYRPGFLSSLRQVLEKSPNTRIFLTSRPHIQSDLEDNIPLDITTITLQPLFSDIEGYLVEKLNTDPHPTAMDDGLRSEIVAKILKESSEIFLLVTLQIDSILGEITIGGRRKKLREMTNGLGDAYTATLERIAGQRGAPARFGISALMWISLAERPLLVDELCHALAIEVESPNIDTEMVPPIETIVASCLGLIAIDHASSTVRLVHATLQEYIRSHQDNIFQNPHATIAKVCLSYLGIQSVRELPPNLQTAPPGFPLLAYASCHWGAHARRELTEPVRHLALGILDQYPQHAAANILLLNGAAPHYPRWGSAEFSGLHCIVYFGINELLEAQLSIQEANPNQTDGWGRTPLILAAQKGNEGAVRILLNRADVNPNSATRNGQTPLFRASLNGHEGVVRTLLSHAEVKPNSPDLGNRTPLCQASANGHQGVVRILLSRADVNPNSPDQYGQTPLCQASTYDHEGVVRILLSRADINPNSADQDGQTPLFRASAYDHEGVVRALLSHADINPNLANRYGQTPLFRASESGHERVVRALLSHADINPNLANRYGQTTLCQASTNGYKGVVKILLSHADVNLNPSDRG